MRDFAADAFTTFATIVVSCGTKVVGFPLPLLPHLWLKVASGKRHIPPLLPPHEPPPFRGGSVWQSGWTKISYYGEGSFPKSGKAKNGNIGERIFAGIFRS